MGVTSMPTLTFGSGAALRLDGHYFSFRTGGNPGDVVDRFEARQTGDRVTCAGWLGESIWCDLLRG